MRREIIIGLVLMLLLSSINIISGNVSAEIKKEDMTWSIGDKWEYRSTTIATTTTILKMTLEVTGEDVVEIDGVNYSVFVAELTGELETVEIALPNTTLAQGSTISGTSYVAKENDETTKTVQNLKYQLINETSGKFFNFTQTIVIITNATSGGKPDVIDVGTNWISTIKTITTMTTTYSGSFFDDYMHMPGYTNTTTTTDTKTGTFNYNCTGKNTTTTAAGTFETYEIEQSNKDGGQGYTLQYLSSTVKGDVKDITYDHEGGTVISLLELISYDVATASSPTPKTPGFELAIVLCSIAIILLWKRKRMN
jgi:hypothetical protein